MKRPIDPLLLEALQEVDELAPAAPPVAPAEEPEAEGLDNQVGRVIQVAYAYPPAITYPLPPHVVQRNDRECTYLLDDGRTVTWEKYWS